MASFIWPPSGGGGGGGSGNVVGPASSTTNGVAAFADTTGELLKDSVLSNKGILVAAGSSPDYATGIVLGDLGLSFAGSAPDENPPHNVTPLYSPGTSGWMINPNDDHSTDYLSFYMSGNMAYQTATGGGTGPNSTQIMLINGTVIRPADVTYVSTIGTPTFSFGATYSKAFYFGGEVGNTGAATRKKVFIDDRNVPNGSPGIGFDSANGNEWYFASMDPSHGFATRENFNLIYDDRTTTVSAPDDVVADVNPAVSIVLKGANKTAGTGDGGNLCLDGGTSLGGAPGNVCMPVTNGAPAVPATVSGFAPFRFDTGTGLLYIHNGTNWLSVQLT